MTRSRFRCLALALLAAPSLALAASTAPDADETVMVLGEKVSRSVHQTATSVTVVDEEALERRPAVETVNDVLDFVPNVTTSETSNLAPAVRGVDGTGPAQGADAYFAGTRPRLNYQVDGRTLSYNESIFADSSLWDVERVEVFRGPQSTLQGRNAIAGAILVKTRDPSATLESGARALVGEYGMHQLSAYLSGPLAGPDLTGRLAIDRRVEDSYVEGFTPYEGVGDPEEFESLNLRGKLRFAPSAVPELSTLLTVSHVDGHAPQTTSVARPFSRHRASFPAMPRFGTRTTSGIADTRWEFSPHTALHALLSATDLQVTRDSPIAAGNVDLDAAEYVAEPRLAFSLFAERVEGFVGTHHFRSSQDEFIDLFGGGRFEDHTQTDAFFFEATWYVAPRLDLSFGGRYEHEERDRFGGAGPFAIDFEESYDAFLPRASLAFHVRDDLTIGVLAARGYNGGGAGFTYDFPFVSYTFDEEYVWNYELFLRSSLLDDRLALTANVFLAEYEDMQLPFDLNPDPSIWAFVVRNADEARTYGAELGSRFTVRPGFELFASLGLLETEITSFPGSGVEGNELPRAPAVALDLGVFYEHPSGFELSADARYRDAYHSTVINEARGKTDGHWIANAEVGYRFRKARVFAGVANLFDAVEPILLEPGATPLDDVAYLRDPRTVHAGIEIAY